MKFKELVEIKNSIDWLVELLGATREAVDVRNQFETFMQRRYGSAELRNTITPELDVPREVIEAFRPLYEVYRVNYKIRTGKELPPLV